MLNQITLGTLKGYELQVKSAQLKVISDFGCNINFLTLKGQEVLDTNSQYEELSKDTLCKSDFLLPFPNRISDGSYIFEGKTYQLEKNEVARGHALHGLIIRKPFTLKSSDVGEEMVTVTFETDLKKEENPGYPFDLHHEITLKLTETSLTITITTRNTGHTNAPYGVGWHPYLTAGKKIDECQIRIPAESELKTSDVKELIPTGEKQHNMFGTEKRLLGNTFFDTCFTDLVDYTVEFENIQVWMDESMKFLQSYTPDARTSIAVEPMSCAPDAFNNGMGLIVLHPSEEVSHHFGVKLI